MRKSFLLISALLLISPALAGYYADIVLSVNEQGTVTINGLTNHPLLSGETDELTSKEGAYWTFNLTLETFDYYVYKALLPQGAVINYLKTPSSVRISDELGRMSITSSGSDEPFELVVQYSIDKQAFNSNWLWGLLAIPAAIITWFVLKKNPKKKKIDHSLLTKRESAIMKLVEKKGRMTQRALEKAVRIPKASLSRNINALIRKGLVKKEKKGLTNLIILEK